MYGRVCSPSGEMKNYTFFPDPASIDDASLSQIKDKDIYNFWSIKLLPGITGVEDTVIPKWAWASGGLTFENIKNSNEQKCSMPEGCKCDARPQCTDTEIKDIYYNFGYIPPTYRVNISDTVGLKISGIISYDSFVQFAVKVGANGIDLDYEETWHADTFKVVNTGPALNTGDVIGGAYQWKTNHGPYMFSQTKGKFARITAVLRKAIDLYAPGGNFKLSIPAIAVGFGETRYGDTSWYGGNLKGLFLNDEACGTGNVPLTPVVDTAIASASEQQAKKIDYTKKCNSKYYWFRYQEMFKKLHMDKYIDSDLDSYEFWNNIFDGGIFPMIYDLGGGVFKDASNLNSETGRIGTFECGPYVKYIPSSSDNEDTLTADPPQPYRPAGVAPYSCDLMSQLKFYSDQYIDNNINIALGFEIGMPNYPRADELEGTININTSDTTLLPDVSAFNIDYSNNYTNFYNNFKDHSKYKYGTFFGNYLNNHLYKVN